MPLYVVDFHFRYTNRENADIFGRLSEGASLYIGKNLVCLNLIPLAAPDDCNHYFVLNPFADCLDRKSVGADLFQCIV